MIQQEARVIRKLSGLRGGAVAFVLENSFLGSLLSEVEEDLKCIYAPLTLW